MNPSRANIPLIRPHQCDSDGGRIRGVLLYYNAIYIYNSVVTRRHRHINSSASTPPNAMKIAEMKDSHNGLVIVGNSRAGITIFDL